MQLLGRVMVLPMVAMMLTMVALVASAQPGVPGGWSKASVKDKEVLAAAAFAVKAQAKELGQKDPQQPEDLKLVQVLRAESQVVAGMNYRLKLKVKHAGKERTAEALVWWQAWRKPEPYELTSWKWQ